MRKTKQGKGIEIENEIGRVGRGESERERKKATEGRMVAEAEEEKGRGGERERETKYGNLKTVEQAFGVYCILY